MSDNNNSDSITRSEESTVREARLAREARETIEEQLAKIKDLDEVLAENPHLAELLAMNPPLAELPAMKTQLEELLAEIRDMEEDLAKEAFGRDMLKAVFPWILHDLLNRGEIDESRIDDLDYLWETIVANVDWLEDRSISIVFLPSDEFVDAARDELDKGRIGAAIVLVATAIEHRLNSHLRFVLGEDGALSHEQVTRVIKDSNFPAKLDWLLELVTGHGLSDELSKRIGRINMMRNSIVHDKFQPIFELTQIGKVYDQAKQLGFDTLLNTPVELEKELKTIELELYPNVARAFDLVAKIFDSGFKPKKTVPPQ